jgi:non-ribosomal peptide synthetase component E (peptide arylation enzyme)
MIRENIRLGYWDSLTNVDFWDMNRRDFPDQEAIVDSHTRLTWAEAWQWIDRIALGLLELGIKRDQALVMQLPNVVEMLLLRVACERAGVLCVQVLRTFRQQELESTLKYVDAVAVAIPYHFEGFDHYGMIQQIRPPQMRHIIIVGDQVPAGAISLREMARTPRAQECSANCFDDTRYQAGEVSLVTVTTGTTGSPKFVENPICSRVRIGRYFAEGVRLTSDDVVAISAAGLGGMNFLGFYGAPIVGARIVMQERFNPEGLLQLIERERITVLSLVPTMALQMIRHPNLGKYDLSSVRVVYMGGAPIGYAEALEIEAKLGGTAINGWGAHDCGVMVFPSLDDPPQVRLVTAGKPMPNCQVVLRDDEGREVAPGEVGEIWATGPSCVSGYFKDPEATWQVWTKDGWFRTGDLGRLDEDGNLVVVGRKKDLIIRGGQNIYPQEVEEMLFSHPAVRSVAIVGMPDPIMGERACAYVALHPGQTLSFDDMVSFLRGKGIAPFKLPERLEVVAQLPMVAEQKVDKKLLRQEIARKLRE